MRQLFLVLTLLCGAARLLPAQETLDSARVRVNAPPLTFGRGLVGTVTQLDRETLVLQEQRPGGSSLSIPVSLISKIEVSRGRIPAGQASRRGATQGALGGALVGGGMGLTYWFVEHRARGNDAMGLGARGAVAGGLLGVLMGSVIGTRKQEVWETVRLSDLALRAGTASVAFTVTR